jgi:WD40 repeat protein
VKLWKVETGKELAALREHTAIVFSVCFSPNGRILASASQDESIKLWQMRPATQAAK